MDTQTVIDPQGRPWSYAKVATGSIGRIHTPLNLGQHLMGSATRNARTAMPQVYFEAPIVCREPS